MYEIWRTQEDDVPAFYCYVDDEELAQDEADRLNSHLDQAGIPSWVTRYYVTP